MTNDFLRPRPVPGPRRRAASGALWPAALAALALAGCAGFSADGGFDRVAALTAERTGATPAWPRDAAAAQAVQRRAAELLAQPLDADAAVELALIAHPGLQARYAGLGIAEADWVRAGRLRNPTFAFSRTGGGGASEIERAVGLDLLGLLTLPLAREVGQQRFEAAQLQAAEAAVGVAAEVRRAWVGAVAAQQQAAYHAQVLDVAEAARELAQRLAQAGNLPRLAHLREQAFHAEAAAQAARSRQQAVAQRERLVRALGLDADDAQRLALPAQLPGLPEAPLAQPLAEQAALQQRLDVQVARHETAALARALGLTRATRVVNVLEVGYLEQRGSAEPRRTGYEVTLELPLFDFGTARVAQAQARYHQALQHTADVARQARSQVREAHAAYLGAYELARHYRDEVVPLRRQISEENLLRYNGMLIDLFALLADAREQVAGVSAALQALREHWLAHADLQAALAGTRPTAAPAPLAAPALPAAAAAGH